MPTVHDFDVRSRVLIGGVVTDVVGWNVSYVLDAIPEAYISLPIGVDVRSGDRSDSHGLVSDLEPFTPVEIYATIHPRSEDAIPEDGDPGFPVDEEFLVFIGFVMKPEFRKEADSGLASMSLKCEGVPAALAGTTQFVTGVTLPGFGSSGSLGDMKLGADKQAKADLQGAILRAIGPAPESTDIWGNALKPLFQEIVRLTTIWAGVDEEAGGNAFAQRSLDRLNVSGGRLDVGPLGLNLNKNDYADFIKDFQFKLAESLVNIFYGVWGRGNLDGTLWGAMLVFAKEFALHFIPTIDEDALIPITPGLRADQPWRHIAADEYFLIYGGKDLNRNFYQITTDVGVVGRQMEADSTWQSSTRPFEALGVASLVDVLPPDDPIFTRGQGRLTLVLAPEWLFARKGLAADTMKPDKGSPDASNPETDADPNKQGEKEVSFQATGLGNSFAAAVLHEELFAERSLQLVGRVRFDICPGSQVSVQTAADVFDPDGGETLWGMVNGVIIEVTNEGKTGLGQTRLLLTHVRSESEQRRMTVQNHPLFQLNHEFVGAKLLSYGKR